MKKSPNPDAPEAVAPEPEKAKPTVRVQDTTEFLPCPLTESRHRDLSVELVELQMEIQRMEEERVDLAKKIKSAHAGAAAKTSILRAGVEEANVDCRETYDFSARTYKMERLDTGETLEARTLYPYELQQNLFDDDDDDDLEDDDDQGSPDPDEDDE